MSLNFTSFNRENKCVKLISTLSGVEYPFERIGEFSENGESLEVSIPDIELAKIRPAANLWERYLDFLPFSEVKPELHLGEGNTPLLPAGKKLQTFTGIQHLFLKNETLNPT